MTTTATTKESKVWSLQEYLERPDVRAKFAKAMPAWLSVDRLYRVVFSQAMRNPAIKGCTPESIMAAVMQCAQLGLEPILGRAYLIPYKNSKKIDGQWVKVPELSFQPGYQGLVDLARRSGTISDMWAFAVYENDMFDLSYGMDRTLFHRPWFMDPEKRKAGVPGECIGAYAVWQLKDGTKHPDFMPIHEIHKRRDKSQAYQYGMAHPDERGAKDSPWFQWYDEQVVKTVIKHSCKLVPASIEFMQAVELDDATDAGLSQVDMAIPLMLPENGEGLTGAQPKVTFEELLPKDVDATAMTKFLGLVAQSNERTIEEVKEAAAKEWPKFWASYEAWNILNTKTTPGIEQQPQAQPAASPKISKGKKKSEPASTPPTESPVPASVTQAEIFPKDAQQADDFTSRFNEFLDILGAEVTHRVAGTIDPKDILERDRVAVLKMLNAKVDE